MASLNKIMLIGNIGNINIKTFADGAKVVEVSLATSEKYTDRNGNQREDVQWHKLVIGGKQADVAEKYMQKGDPLYCEGRMVYRKYTNQAGEEKQAAEVRVQHFQLMGRKKDAQAEAAPQEEVVDDLPFDR